MSNQFISDFASVIPERCFWDSQASYKECSEAAGILFDRGQEWTEATLQQCYAEAVYFRMSQLQLNQGWVKADALNLFFRHIKLHSSFYQPLIEAPVGDGTYWVGSFTVMIRVNQPIHGDWRGLINSDAEGRSFKETIDQFLTRMNQPHDRKTVPLREWLQKLWAAQATLRAIGGSNTTTGAYSLGDLAAYAAIKDKYGADPLPIQTGNAIMGLRCLSNKGRKVPLAFAKHWLYNMGIFYNQKAAPVMLIAGMSASQHPHTRMLDFTINPDE